MKTRELVIIFTRHMGLILRDVMVELFEEGFFTNNSQATFTYGISVTKGAPTGTLKEGLEILKSRQTGSAGIVVLYAGLEIEEHVGELESTCNPINLAVLENAAVRAIHPVNNPANLPAIRNMLKGAIMGIFAQISIKQPTEVQDMQQV